MGWPEVDGLPTPGEAGKQAAEQMELVRTCWKEAGQQEEHCMVRQTEEYGVAVKELLPAGEVEAHIG